MSGNCWGFSPRPLQTSSGYSGPAQIGYSLETWESWNLLSSHRSPGPTLNLGCSHGCRGRSQSPRATQAQA